LAYFTAFLDPFLPLSWPPKNLKKTKTIKVKEWGGEENVWCEKIVSFEWAIYREKWVA